MADYNSSNTGAEIDAAIALAETSVQPAGSTFTGDITFDAEMVTPPHTITYASSVTVDTANGTLQNITLTGAVTSTTYTITSGEHVVLTILQSGGPHGFDFAGVTFVNNAKTAPTLTADPAVFVFWNQGGTVYAVLVGDGT